MIVFVLAICEWHVSLRTYCISPATFADFLRILFLCVVRDRAVDGPSPIMGFYTWLHAY